MVVPQKEERPKELGKTGRYWPGKAPEYVAPEVKLQPRKKRKTQAITIIKDKDIKPIIVKTEKVAEVISAPKSKEKKPIAEVIVAEDDDEEDDRRERIRQRLLRKAQMEADGEMEIEEEDEEEEEEEEDSESGSEYETESSDDDDDFFPSRPLAAPKFVSKAKRETIHARDEVEEEEERLQEQKKIQLQQRKKESKQMVIDDLTKALNQTQVESEDSATDSENEDDEERELESWKQRELARIKRDKDQKEELEKERQETERRRKMTDAEIKKEDELLGKVRTVPKKKYKFLQKYYHKGAFFQDEDHHVIAARDYSEATGEDKADKSMLPAVMQVKNFGRSGRTKYTHLVDQDTTDWSAGWAQTPLSRSSRPSQSSLQPPPSKSTIKRS